jgi:hypothetical protein
MKSLNAKRIAAVAASLLVGLAAAGQGVYYNSVPIINTQGQPVVQIVVGSQAQPSDGVVAANIAAVIGSLAHTSQPITATISGRSGVHCVVTTPTCTLSNQQVWLGEQGLVVPKGSYSFSALIGSVLNGGVENSGTLSYTKIPQSSSNSYVYSHPSSGPYPITSSPTATSAYTGTSATIATGSPTPAAGSTGGGMTFTQFTKNSVDNILELTSAQGGLGLLSNSGNAQETESLWLAGFPVFNQNSGDLSLFNTNGAYLATFGKPITNTETNRTTGESISLLGQNWTVYNLAPPSMTGVTSSTFVVGGNVTLAQASTPPTVIYVGQNITSGPFKVVLTDLSYPDSNGLSQAALSIYKNGVLKNVTSIGPSSAGTASQHGVINASGTKLYITVSQTFPGLYAYQKWAKIQLFSNTVNVTSGDYFNTNNKAWDVALRWTTNQSSTGGATTANAALQGIVLYNGNESSSVILTPGTNFDYISSPSQWQVNFAGDSLGQPSSGNSNYDHLTLSTGSSSSAVTYSNSQGGAAVGPVTVTGTTFNNANVVEAGATPKQVNITTVTEPVNKFTVSSSIPTAFQVSGAASFPAPTSNQQNVTYNLDPYTFNAVSAVDAAGLANVIATGQGGLIFKIVNNGVSGNYLNQSTLSVTASGYYGTTKESGYGPSVSGFANMNTPGSSNTQIVQGDYLTNMTGITLGYAVPYPGVNVIVYETANTAAGITLGVGGNDVVLGYLNYSTSPTDLYSVPQRNYEIASPSPTAAYTGEQYLLDFSLGTTSRPSTAPTGRTTYYTYTIPEITVPGVSTASANVVVDLTNSSSVTTTPLYWLNYTNGNNNAVEYQSSQNIDVKATQGFRTERGGEVSSISTSQIVYDEPKSVDGLNFIVGPASNSNSNTLTTKLYGPYTVGQATNIPNVTIGKVNATCAFTTSSCNVTGLSNLTAVPSASQAIVPTVLNTVTTPLAVLDSGASNASSLIVVGSKYVNSVAAQIFASQPSLNSSFGPSSAPIVQVFGNKILVAGYSAAQTVQAGDEFINALLNASTS